MFTAATVGTVSADDDADCVEHVWRLVGVDISMGGSLEEYECRRCHAVMVYKPSR